VVAVTDLYIVIGSVVVVAGMVGLIAWLAKSVGEGGGESDRIRDEIRRRAKMESLLVRRRRSRNGVVDWMRRRGSDE